MKTFIEEFSLKDIFIFSYFNSNRRFYLFSVKDVCYGKYPKNNNFHGEKEFSLKDIFIFSYFNSKGRFWLLKQSYIDELTSVKDIRKIINFMALITTLQYL